MGETSRPTPVLLIVAIFSRYDEALAWAKARCAGVWGEVALESDEFAFQWTPYYESSMGDNLRKLFLAFAEPVDPGRLPEFKHQANSWEREYAGQARHEVARPLNLDPGYVTQGKLILASTKNHAHRIYLSDGIYAELTLQYRKKCWQKMPWTYPDYCQAAYHEFFTQCRPICARVCDKLSERRPSSSFNGKPKATARLVTSLPWRFARAVHGSRVCAGL